MITIRKAGVHEVPEIMEMWEEFFGSHDRLAQEREPRMKKHTEKKSNANERVGKFISGMIRCGRGRVHIAEVDGKIAGYSFIFIKKNVPIFKIDRIGYMGDLFVKEKYRGMGISSRFKEEAFSWFRKKGMKYASIAVNSTNSHAHKIYRKWGFIDYHIEMRYEIQ